MGISRSTLAELHYLQRDSIDDGSPDPADAIERALGEAAQLSLDALRAASMGVAYIPVSAVIPLSEAITELLKSLKNNARLREWDKNNPL